MGRHRSSIKTSIKHIRTAAWFPPGDEVSTCMARLCILREDLYIELQGMREQPLPMLDDCSLDMRQIYFFRNMLRTLGEIGSAIHTLRSTKSFDVEFQQFLPQVQQIFGQIDQAFRDSHEQVKKARNEMGGHVKHTAVEEGLLQIAPDTKDLYQRGYTAVNIHYKFALELIGATMLRHVPYSSAKEEWKSILTRGMRLGFQAIKAIDVLFVSYVQIRKLT
jgi:hypothetical protein